MKPEEIAVFAISRGLASFSASRVQFSWSAFRFRDQRSVSAFRVPAFRVPAFRDSVLQRFAFRASAFRISCRVVAEELHPIQQRNCEEED